MRILTGDDVPNWVNDTLLSPTRTRPIVAVTSHQGSDRGWVDPEALQASLGDLAEVVFLETGEPTWALSESLPPRLEAYGGALRVWWPGLTTESDPYHHRLYLARSTYEAERVTREIVEAVIAHGRGQATDAQAPAEPIDLPPEPVRITALAADEVIVAGSNRKGPLRDNDLPLSILVDAAEIDMELTARPVRRLTDGRWEFSSLGLLPDPWRQFANDVRVGDVVPGRVQNLNEEKNLVFVDLLPGVVGVCHKSQLDWSFVSRLADFVQKGEILTWKVLEIDADRGMVQLSRKAAYGESARELPSLLVGGRPFVWRDGLPWFQNIRRARPTAAGARAAEPKRARPAAPAPTPAPPVALEPGERLADLTAELAAANDDRQNLRDRIRKLRDEKKDLERRLDEIDRRAALEDPLASERAFLAGVRTAYARMLDEHDRFAHPLQRMRIGREFLDSVHSTPGIELDKLLEVCAQVASELAHTVPGRDVHPLRAGSRGAGDRMRARDGARAWRCALKQAPSAPRLHWWIAPGDDGAVIEFACVGLHDDFDIPEA